MPKDYLTPEERLFADRVEDLFSIVESRSIPKFSSFLDERQQAIAKQVAPRGNYLLYAGHPGEGDRLMLGVFPSCPSLSATAGRMPSPTGIFWVR